MPNKSLQVAKTILRKRNRAGGIMLPDFRLYYKASVIRTVRSWHKRRHVSHWDRTESQEVNTYIYVKL